MSVLGGHLAGLHRADGLEGVDDRDGLLGAVAELDPAGRDRAGIEEHAREVEARRTFQKDNFRVTQPRLAASWTSEYASTVASRRANSDKAHACHIQFS